MDKIYYYWKEYQSVLHKITTMFSNHVNTPEDNEFIRQFPIPDEFDPEWVAKMESELSCQDCEYYNNNGILPCAVNPEKLHQTNECNDYSIGGENND